VNIHYSAVASTLACLLAGAALAVSMAHGGPQGRDGRQGLAGSQGVAGLRGPAGPQGSAPREAGLGICYEDSQVTSGAVTYVNYVYIGQPVISGGVVTCTPGTTYVPVMPSQP
jgi:hypothetical protein